MGDYKMVHGFDIDNKKVVEIVNLDNHYYYIDNYKYTTQCKKCGRYLRQDRNHVHVCNNNGISFYQNKKAKGKLDLKYLQLSNIITPWKL